MRLNAVLAGTGLLLALLAPGTSAIAQDEAASASEEPGSEETKSKTPFGLYVEAAAGQATAREIDASITTLTTHRAYSYLNLEDQAYARAALGWRLPHGKGDFRIRFDGFKEDGYTFSSSGVQAALDQSLDVPNAVTGNLDWWALEVVDGAVHAVRTPPVWDPLVDDANANGSVEPEEVRYPYVDLDFNSNIASDLQNRAQAIDLMYGRKFGSGRYSARWWAGFRYFVYEGNIKSAAWLQTTPTGEGYTDNALLPLLNFHNESSGWGPMGSMEVDFNFFDDRLALYLQGEFAFMMMDLSVESGPFATLVVYQPQGSNVRYVIPIDADLAATRNKSTWQDAAEAGVRLKLRNGLQLELAYRVTGYLDVIIMPSDISIPENREEAAQGSSALYRTQDYVLEGWRAGIAFQF
jgi:hypothetical protein